MSLLIGVLALLVLATGCRPSAAEVHAIGACEVTGTYDFDGDGICFGYPSHPSHGGVEAAGAPLAAIKPDTLAISFRVERVTIDATAARAPPRFVAPGLRPPIAAAL